MNLPFKNHVWSLLISLFKNFFNRSAIQPEANLKTTLYRLIGRKYFKYCLGFPSLGIHVIIPNLFVSEKCNNS